MKFNIEQLEKLACLKLSDTQKNNLSSGMQDIIDMLKTVENEVNPNQKKITPLVTSFRNDQFISPVKDGLNITESGYFLAPKTIKTD